MQLRNRKSLVTFTGSALLLLLILLLIPFGAFANRAASEVKDDSLVFVPLVIKGSPWQIAYHSERDGNSEIFLMSTDGQMQMQLTTDPAFDGVPKWSPDAEQIAFQSERD